jgi:5-hydroxyisourate hydrolase
MSAITTHVLDLALGRPAAGVGIALERREDGDGLSLERWSHLGSGTTDTDGRLKALLPDSYVVQAGTYRLRFDTAAYFDEQKVDCFYPTVTIEFAVRKAGEHYHVPLLLSPFGYSTYRGS